MDHDGAFMTLVNTGIWFLAGADAVDKILLMHFIWKITIFLGQYLCVCSEYLPACTMSSKIHHTFCSVYFHSVAKKRPVREKIGPYLTSGDAFCIYSPYIDASTVIGNSPNRKLLSGCRECPCYHRNKTRPPAQNVDFGLSGSPKDHACQIDYMAAISQGQSAGIGPVFVITFVPADVIRHSRSRTQPHIPVSVRRYWFILLQYPGFISG